MAFSKRISVLLVVAGALCLPSSTPALTLDDFSEGTGNIDVSDAVPAAGADIDSGLSTSHTIGGVRQASLLKSGGVMGEHVIAAWNPPVSALGLTRTGLAFGQLQLYYDGDANATQNPDGMSVDFNAAGTGVLVRATSSVAATMPLRLHTNINSASRATINLVPGVGSYFIAFTAFTQSFGDPGINAPANFADIGAVDVVLAIDSGSRTIDDISVVTPIVDADGDGVSPPLDCNDGDAKIKPGATEKKGNTIDENCDRVIEPFPLLTPTIRTHFSVHGSRTKITGFQTGDIPTGTDIAVSCSGRGCPFTSKHVAGAATVDLKPLFKKKKLKAGVVIEVRITAPETIGKAIAYTIRKGKQPSSTTLCLPPGSSSPTAC